MDMPSSIASDSGLRCAAYGHNQHLYVTNRDTNTLSVWSYNHNSTGVSTPEMPHSGWIEGQSTAQGAIPGSALGLGGLGPLYYQDADHNIMSVQCGSGRHNPHGGPWQAPVQAGSSPAVPGTRIAAYTSASSSAFRRMYKVYYQTAGNSITEFSSYDQTSWTASNLPVGD